MASSLNGLSVGDPLPENLMDSPARSDSMFYLRQTKTLTLFTLLSRTKERNLNLILILGMNCHCNIHQCQKTWMSSDTVKAMHAHHHHHHHKQIANQPVQFLLTDSRSFQAPSHLDPPPPPPPPAAVTTHHHHQLHREGNGDLTQKEGSHHLQVTYVTLLTWGGLHCWGLCRWGLSRLSLKSHCHCHCHWHALLMSSLWFMRLILSVPCMESLVGCWPWTSKEMMIHEPTDYSFILLSLLHLLWYMFVCFIDQRWGTVHVRSFSVCYLWNLVT